MKKLLFAIIVFIFPVFVFASDNQISSIKIDVNLLENGDAYITEVWNTSITSGTELYKVYGNMTGYKISDFKVTDKNNNIFTYQSSWNVNDSFDNKKYKNGINYENNDLELCWGISDYGDNSYTLTYLIEDLVLQNTDSQGIYFTFLSKKMNLSPDNVIINIHSNVIEFNEDNSEIYAYGYPSGNIKYQNGNILMNSSGRLKQSEYMSLLLKINDTVFSSNHLSNKNFNELRKDSSNDSSNNTTSSNDTSFSKNDSSVKVFSLMFIVLIILLVIMLGMKIYYSITKKTLIKTKKTPKLEVDTYNREIPCNKDIIKIFCICKRYDLITDESSILGSFLLKWIKEGRLVVTDYEGELALDLSKLGEFSDPIEEKLKNIFLMAASRDNLLIESEFKEWCKNQYKEVFSWYSDLYYEGNKRLEADKLIKVETIELTNTFGNKVSQIKTTNLEKGEQVAKDIIGIKNFMLEFGSMQEKSLLETIVWEEYLIIAQMLGIADKVIADLKKIYPDYKFIKSLDIDRVITVCSNFEHTAYDYSNDAVRLKSGSSIDSIYSSSYSNGSGGKSFSGGARSSGGFSSRGGGGVR